MEIENQTKKSRVAPFVEHMSCGGSWCKRWAFVLIIVFLLVWGLSWRVGVFFQIDRGTYQAIFLTNGQAYFGKLRVGFGDFLTLKDAHYPQIAPAQQTAGAPPLSINILSVENQPQTPVGELYISKKQVLFWENLKPDSPAIQVIGSQKAAAQQ